MNNLSIKARVFILGTILAGMIINGLQLSQLAWQNPLLLVLAGLASVAQLLKVEGATEKSSYNISWLVTGFAFVSQGASAALFVILVAHLVEWAWHRYPWYIQAFNISNYALVTALAGGVYTTINPNGTPLRIHGALGILASLAVFTLVNHFLVGVVIRMARGQSFSQSGVFSPLTLMIDYSMIGMGAATALIWIVNPYAVALSALPLYLIYSTLRVPALQRQTEIDPKTRLFNARYFADALEKELARAERFQRPLTVVMADLDLLRNINNSYGHVAGDVVLIGMAEILQQHAREYDVVARFGGEEFALMMPETGIEQAYPLVESMRQAIESTDFEVNTSVTPIKVTMSFGLTGREGESLSVTEIIHNADLALYHSKLSGRNQTSIYTEGCINGLFGEPAQTAPNLDEAALQARLDLSQKPFQPHPVRAAGRPAPQTNSRPDSRERADPAQPAGQQPAVIDQQEPPATNAVRPRPNWMVRVFVGAVAFSALGLFWLTYQHDPGRDWLALGVFALITALSEALSIEIYVRDTTISTSAAPLIAGALLFGAPGAVVLSLVLAGVAFLKNRSPLHRLVFNSGNHLIGTSLAVGLASLYGGSFQGLSIPMQFGTSLAAALVSYLSSTLLIAAAMGLSTGYPLGKIWAERFRWLWPFYLAYGVVAYAFILGYAYVGLFGVLVILVPLLTLRFSQTQYLNHTKGIVQQLRKKNTELENYAAEITTLNEELLLALSHIVDLRDPYVYGHSQQVTRYAIRIGRQMGLSPMRMESLRKAALLHDIGKIGISETILFKPGPLTAEEYEIVKAHTINGADIIETVHSLHPLTLIVRHHHERFDGGGYPDGLKGQDIPLEARILCLADSLEAMASDRPYRRALSRPELLNEIRENAGTQFDPAVVDALQTVLAEEGQGFVINSARYLEATELAMERSRSLKAGGD